MINKNLENWCISTSRDAFRDISLYLDGRN